MIRDLLKSQGLGGRIILKLIITELFLCEVVDRSHVYQNRVLWWAHVTAGLGGEVFGVLKGCSFSQEVLCCYILGQLLR
jgi:hypothetical protein